MNHPTTLELLGPVDLGRDEDWTHIGFRGQGVALCGEACSEDIGPVSDGIPGRPCPDCLRIARGMGFPINPR